MRAGNDLQVIVPTDRAGVELLDDWDGFGQRTTATGTSRFTDVVVHPDEVTTVSSGMFLGHGTAFPAVSGRGDGENAAAVCVQRRSTLSGTGAAAHLLAEKAAQDPFVLCAVVGDQCIGGFGRRNAGAGCRRCLGCWWTAIPLDAADAGGTGQLSLSRRPSW